MTVSVWFAAVAFGLLVLPIPDPVHERLDWLSAARWGATTTARESGRRIAWMARGRRLVGSRSGCAVCAGTACAVVCGPIPAVAAAVAGWWLSWCWSVVRADHARAEARSQRVAVVAALIDELAGGTTTDTALVAVAATAEGYAEPLSKASMAIRDGADPTVALASFPDLSALALAIRTAQQTGTPLAGVLRGVLADANADQLASRAVATALAGPRTSAALLALLPVIGLAMGWAMGADPIRVLLHTAAGQIALAAGILLDTAGLTWTVAMTRRATT